jgi:hypothetical protein
MQLLQKQCLSRTNQLTLALVRGDAIKKKAPKKYLSPSTKNQSIGLELDPPLPPLPIDLAARPLPAPAARPLPPPLT